MSTVIENHWIPFSNGAQIGGQDLASSVEAWLGSLPSQPQMLLYRGR